jgi:chromosome segregation ATPase
MNQTDEEKTTFEKDRIDALLKQPTESSYTNEWYRRQFQRLDHINKLLHTELVEVCHQVRSLRKELHETKQQRLEDAVEIGRLTDTIEEMKQRIAKLETRMDKASEQFSALKSKVTTANT